MKTSHWIIVAIIVLAGAGLLFWVSKSKKDDTQVKSDSNTSQTQDQENNNSQTTDTNTNSTNTASNTNTASQECTRNVDQKAMQDPIDIKNKFVTLTIKDLGDVKIQLYDKDAPKTVENFLRLSASGYYDCLTFHRIIPGFMIQGGDPSGNGSGGESAFGGKFADELDPNTPSAKAGYVKGVVAMANAGPNTNGSQFFIMHQDYPLPHDYTIFGKVVSGQDVVDKVALKGSPSGVPQEKVEIEKAVVSDK